MIDMQELEICPSAIEIQLIQECRSECKIQIDMHICIVFGEGKVVVMGTIFRSDFGTSRNSVFTKGDCKITTLRMCSSSGSKPSCTARLSYSRIACFWRRACNNQALNILRTKNNFQFVQILSIGKVERSLPNAPIGQSMHGHSIGVCPTPAGQTRSSTLGVFVSMARFIGKC